MYYTVKYSGTFGFIKPWTAVRDAETYSQQFLTPSIMEGMRQKLVDDRAKPIIDETAGAELFVTLPCAAYIETEIESVDALDKAEQKLTELMQAFDYENQICTVDA